MEFLTDFHSHILPGIDDGSDSVETSMKLLQMSAAQGVRHMAATPHFYAHRHSLERFLEKRNRAEAQLREAVLDRTDLPEITVGAEVFFFRGMGESDALQQLTIGDTSYILVEMPFAVWTEEMYRELESIHDNQGLTPVIAHVERYFGHFSTRKIPERLSKLPVLVQSNASFFLDRKTSARALKLLQKGQIHLLGSDCHNLRTRIPNLGPAMKLIEDRLGPEAAARVHGYGEMVFAPEDPA